MCGTPATPEQAAWRTIAAGASGTFLHTKCCRHETGASFIWKIMKGQWMVWQSKKASKCGPTIFNSRKSRLELDFGWFWYSKCELFYRHPPDVWISVISTVAKL
jgi:hypothetical protein